LKGKKVSRSLEFYVM